MTIRATLDHAGDHEVVQITYPHFSNPALLTGSRAGVLHTTEGGWDGSMGVFHAHFAPQFIVSFNAHYVAHKRLGTPLPKPPTGAVEIAQLVPVGTIGAALCAHNNEALVQVEVVSVSKETPWLFDEQTLAALADLMATCRGEYGIPLTRPWPDSVRGLSGATKHRNDGHFGKVAGWLGHGDCPSPDTHWHPGHLQWSALFARAEAGSEGDASARASRTHRQSCFSGGGLKCRLSSFTPRPPKGWPPHRPRSSVSTSSRLRTPTIPTPSRSMRRIRRSPPCT